MTNSVPSSAKWIDLPQPPRPQGFNDTPAATPPVIVGSQMVTGRIPIGEFSDFLVISRLDVHGHYLPIVEATATLETPYSHQTSVTVGASETDTFSMGWSVTVEANADVAKISSTLTDTFQHSQTISKSETVSNTFGVTPTAAMPKVTVVWWQANFIYTLTPIHVYQTWRDQRTPLQQQPDGWYDGTGSKYCDLSYTITNKITSFASSQYPDQTGAGTDAKLTTVAAQ